MTSQELERYKSQLSNTAREAQIEQLQNRDKAVMERVNRSVRIPPVKVGVPPPQFVPTQAQQARTQGGKKTPAPSTPATGEATIGASSPSTASNTPARPAGPSSFVQVQMYGSSPYGQTEALAGTGPAPIIQVNRGLVNLLAPGSAPLNPFVPAAVATNSPGATGGWTPTPSAPLNTCDVGAPQKCCDIIRAGLTLPGECCEQPLLDATFGPGYFPHSRCGAGGGGSGGGGIDMSCDNGAPLECCRNPALVSANDPACCDSVTVSLKFPGYHTHSGCKASGGGGGNFVCDPNRYQQPCCDFAKAYTMGMPPPPNCCGTGVPPGFIPLPAPYCP